jgi:hypothetical protein
MLLNVAPKGLALLLHTQEVSDSNLGPETGYPDWSIFMTFQSSSRQMLGYCLKLGHDHFFPYPSQFINHFIIQHYVVWTTDSVTK